MADDPEPIAQIPHIENVNLRISGNMAWVTFDQFGEDTGSQAFDMPGLSRETRILEKQTASGRSYMLVGCCRASSVSWRLLPAGEARGSHMKGLPSLVSSRLIPCNTSDRHTTSSARWPPFCEAPLELPCIGKPPLCARSIALRLA